MILGNHQPMFSLQRRDKAPAFEAKIQDGSIISLDKITTNWIVLFFYPKGNTPTCTKEACNLRDHYADLKKLDASIYGISPDSENKHRSFISKFSLPYDLIVDENHRIASDYGVWGTKKFMGLEYHGIHRSTFILDKEHKIHQIIYPVVSATHHDQIIKSILSIQ